MTKINITPKWIDVKPSGYYVYVHKRSTDNTPFYVGKGLKDRGWHKSGASRGAGWWMRTAIKHGVVIDICQDGMIEDDAFLLEMWLIAKLRNEGCRLCNLTDGGEGASGFKQSDETKELRASKMRGDLHPFYGKKLSQEHCLNLSISHLGKMSGRDSPTYKHDEFSFWNIDGRGFVGTRNEFMNYSGLSSGGVSRLVLGRRKIEKGWYVSDREMTKSEIFDGRILMPDGNFAVDAVVYSNLGEEFTNAQVAATSIAGPNASGWLVISACMGSLNTAYGRTWSFSKDGPFTDYKDPRRSSADAKFKKIECSNGMVFIGAKSASDWLSKDCGRTIGPPGIYQAIRKSGNSGGYKWSYIDG